MWPFRVDGGVVEDKKVVVIRVVLLKNVNCVVNLPQNILVGEVPFPVCSRTEEHSCGLCSIGGTQPAVVSRDKIRDHQRDPFTFWQGNRFLADVNPTTFSLIVLKKYALIMEPEDTVSGWQRGGWVNGIGEVLFVPDPHSWLTFSESREIDILTVTDNIRMFVSINICSFWCLPPCEIEFRHPLAGSTDGNRCEDVIACRYLRSFHKVDNGLGGHIHPDAGDISK